MARKKPDPKSAPGLVNIRLQLAPEERERLRVVAAAAGKPMAIWCRDAVRAAMARSKAPAAPAREVF